MINFHKKSENIRLILILLLFSTGIISSQEYTLTFNSDSITKNKSFKYESYEELILGIDDSLSSLNKIGYINAEVKSLKMKKSLSYEVVIEKNKKLKFIEITNVSRLENEIQYILENYFTDGSLIKFDEIETVFEEISELLSKRGYPFAKIRLDKNEVIGQTKIRSEILIKIGEKRFLDKVIVKGYKNFPKKFIKNIFRLYKPRSFDVSQIRPTAALIDNLLFVKNIKDPEILFTNDSTSLFLYLQEVKKNSFDGFIGFDSDENSGKINIQGYANISLINPFNKGEEINFNFRSENEEDRSLNTEIIIPYVFGSKFDFNYSLNIIKKDSSFTLNKNSFNLVTKLGGIKSGLGFQQTRSSSGYISENILDYSSFLINVSATYENFDFEDKLIKENFRFLFRLGFGEKTQSNLKSNKDLIKIEILKKFNFSSKIKFLTSVSHEKINSQNLVTNELLRFGGANSLRGFDENSIFADRYSLLNTSLNYYLNDTIYIYNTFGIANYTNSVTNFEDNLYSGGLGFTTKTENGVISVNYSKGDVLGKRFNFKNAKISINFITFF